MENREWLFGKTLSELELIVEELGEKKFRARQLAEWLYPKGALDIDEMTSLSKSFRERLSAKYVVGKIDFSERCASVDGTVKYIFPTLKGALIESVYIPDRTRGTLCVSSQAGCKMNCGFCMTGRGGWHHNLTTGEILGQIRDVGVITPLTNIVYMGMGEPLDNLDNVMKSFEVLTSSWGYAMSPTRITLSSIGIIKNLKHFIEECNIHLAISLHNPFSSERKILMPVEKVHNITEIVALIKKYDFTHQRRVSFEYTMFKGYNDTKRHIDGLVELLQGVKCRINLIRFHKIPDSDLEPSTEEQMVYFRDTLTRKGIITTIRASRGEDIFAACGMLKGDC